MRRSLASAIVVAASAAGAGAAFADDPTTATGAITGTITVTRPADQPVSPILVYVVGFTAPAPEVTVEVVQKDKHFVPDLVAITAGQTVSFPNGDPFLHNVFSPTASRRFDLGSYKKGDTRKRRFPTAGVSDIYCNIHPEMSATIVVLPNRTFTLAAADGSYALSAVPVGTWTVFAYSRRSVKPVSAQVEVAAGATVAIDLALDETRRDFSHRNKFGEKYRDGAEYRPSK